MDIQPQKIRSGGLYVETKQNKNGWPKRDDNTSDVQVDERILSETSGCFLVGDLRLRKRTKRKHEEMYTGLGNKMSRCTGPPSPVPSEFDNGISVEQRRAIEATATRPTSLE
jgi:hypothetical protein